MFFATYKNVKTLAGMSKITSWWNLSRAWGGPNSFSVLTLRLMLPWASSGCVSVAPSALHAIIIKISYSHRVKLTYSLLRYILEPYWCPFLFKWNPIHIFNLNRVKLQRLIHVKLRILLKAPCRKDVIRRRQRKISSTIPKHLILRWCSRRNF